MEDNLTVDICGLTIKINEGGKSTVYDIEDYRTRQELIQIIEDTLKKHKNGRYNISG